MVATAHPAKFETIVEPLIEKRLEIPPALAALISKPSQFIEIESRKTIRLFRTCSENSNGKIDGYLEDYAFLGMALLDLFGVGNDHEWLRGAQFLSIAMLELFWDTEKTGFYFTSAGKIDLIARTKELHDGSTPAGNSVAIMLFCRRCPRYAE